LTVLLQPAMETPSPLQTQIRRLVGKLLVRSLRASGAQRGYGELKQRLEEIIPDISNQYSFLQVNPQDVFLQEKLRNQHAFQMELLLKAMDIYVQDAKREIVHVVDVGDSSGAHLRYLNELVKEKGIAIRSMSVNLDPEAVKKIQAQGMAARQCRAEKLHLLKDGLSADIFISYETLEHLFDPIGFLHDIAIHSSCSYFVITVPYVRRSRVGLHHLRRRSPDPVYAENTHIFELCPEDWGLIFNFAGWEIVCQDCYTQYPSAGLLKLTKYLWRRKDFDGFLGVILTRRPEKAAQYRSWS